MESHGPLWREQLRDIPPSQRPAAFASVEHHLIEDMGFEPSSPEILLARVAIGNYTTKDSEGNELPGKPRDIYEAAAYKGIELTAVEAETVDEALAETLPQVVRVWGKNTKTDTSPMPVNGTRTYMNKAEFNHSLLTREEEQKLIQAITLGRELSDEEDLTPAQQAIVDAGKRAQEELVLHNLKFAAYKARFYAVKGYDMDDLIQVANIGMVRAAQQVQPNMDAKFTTFAATFIKHDIQNFIAGGKSGVRIKSRYYETIDFMNNERRLAERLGHAPTVQDLIDNDETGKLDPQTIAQFRQSIALIEQVEMPEVWREEYVHEELDPDHSWRTPSQPKRRPVPYVDEAFEATLAELRAETIESVLETLSEREETVIRLRYGLNEGESQMTYQKVGEVVGVTRERIRQIEQKAMEKLRHPSRARFLKGYF